LDSSLQTVHGLVLNNSAKIYLLFHPCKSSLKKHYEELIAQCLWPLLSKNTTDDSPLSDVGVPKPQSFLEDCYERLTSCQSNLLVYLLEELTSYLQSSHYFSLFHYQTPSSSEQALCEKIMLYAHCENDVIHQDNYLKEEDETLLISFNALEKNK